MGRWEPDASGRLMRAALELFTEQGFTPTTVPQITARAGLTTRTFFRHFADKREVLFVGEQQIPRIVAEMMSTAPPELSPLKLVSTGLDQVAEHVFAGQWSWLRVRRAVVASDVGLQERELKKGAVLSQAVRAGFLARGYDDLPATLIAHFCVTVFTVSVERWLDQPAAPGAPNATGSPHRPLQEFLHETLTALQAVAADDVTVPNA
jgi:AcrR family transcriptional regulator